jgi:uncharacterized protein with PQ loop repeat
MNPTEIMGYAASLGVLLSFLMKDIKTLRVVNSIGCALFIIYGYMLPKDSMPIIVTNVAIIIINIYFLMKDRKKTNP